MGWTVYFYVGVWRYLFDDKLNKSHVSHFYNLTLIAKFEDQAATNCDMKRFYAFSLLLIATLFCSIPLSAHDFEVDGIYYNIEEADIFDRYKQVVAVTFKGDSFDEYTNEYTGNVVIPDSVSYLGTTYSVTGIGAEAFRKCVNMTSITIPNSVDAINITAFWDCRGLAEIVVVDGHVGFDSRDNCNAIIMTKTNVLIVGCKNTIIPNSVLGIVPCAFYGCSGLTEITIPNSVTSIEGETFKNCSGLTEITIPNSVTSIGEGAFVNCSSLTSVTIPNSVTTICDKAFAYCSSLTSVTIPNSVTHIGKNAFSECSNLAEVNIPNSVPVINPGVFSLCSSLAEITIPNSVRGIAENAFYGCEGLTTVTIPNSVTGIGAEAFAYCNSLTSVTIPNSVVSIGNDAFLGCGGLNKIVVEEGNSVYDSRDNCNAIIETATDRLIVGCNNTIIPNSVTNIDDYAFLYCEGLTEITIPKSVVSIGNNAFLDCGGLNKIVVEEGNSVYDSRNNCNAIIHTATDSLIVGCNNTIIPNSITKIGDRAFQWCSGLTEITIPNSVTSIGESAFWRCSGLTYVSIGNSVTSIGEHAFSDCSLKELRFEDSTHDLDVSHAGILGNDIESLYLGRNIKGSIGGSSALKNVTISNSVTSIGEEVFSGCSGLTEITIPNSVTSIGKNAFSSCSGLTEITIPNSVTSIGESAFNECTGLTSVSIGNSVTSIDRFAFYRCDNIKELRIEDSALNLELASSGFGLELLESLYLGRNVSANGHPAFSHKKSLKNVTIGNAVTSIGEEAFEYCSSLTSVTIPTSVTRIGKNAFYECSSLAEVNIPNSVTNIDEGTFYGCSSLASLTIPNSVTSIGRFAFSGCKIKELCIEDSAYDLDISSADIDDIESLYLGRNIKGSIGSSTLKNVTISNSVTTICESAFWGCRSLTSVTIPESVVSIGNSAFSGCGGLNKIVVEEGNSVYDSRDNCNAIIETATSSLLKGCNNTIIPNSVTKIEDYAFYGCTGLTSVTIPNSVYEIGQFSFDGCSGLSSITIGSSVNTICPMAFAGCNSLEFIKVLNPIPPCISSYYTFDHYESSLVVPDGSLFAYSQADVWRNFSNITEVSGIEDVKVDATEVEEVVRYDIDGRLLTEPTPGINIIKMSDGSTRKEWIK